MPLDFPNSPSLNQTYSFGVKTWIWNGTAWQLTSSTGSINGTPIGNITPSTGAFTTLSASGNITGNNASITNHVSATGNITGNYFFGNGSQLTGIDATSIQSGTSNVRVVSSSGNVTIGISGTSNIVVVSTSGVAVTGAVSATGNVTGGNMLSSGSISVTGNITGGNVLGGANVNATTFTGTTVSVSGNITGGNLSVGTGTVTVGTIVNANANGVGNIGSASLYFNTVFAKATSAQYADLAENYQADYYYEAGTVVIFGGKNEVTKSILEDDHRVAGVISTNPSHLMNAGQLGDYIVAVALQGRVPCRIIGPVEKGDLLVSATEGRAKANNQARAGTIIGKALEQFAGTEGMIEIAVGRD